MPDIGDYSDVRSSILFVKVGDTVKVDTLVTPSPTKATMDVPSRRPALSRRSEGQSGDKISEGSVVVIPKTSRKIGCCCIRKAASARQQFRTGRSTRAPAAAAFAAVSAAVGPTLPLGKQGARQSFGVRPRPRAGNDLSKVSRHRPKGRIRRRCHRLAPAA